jgi:hypothetical protein
MTANLSLYPDASPAALDIVRNRAKLVRHLPCSLLLVLAVGSTGRQTVVRMGLDIAKNAFQVNNVISVELLK